MFPTRQRDRQKGSQSQAAAGSRKKRDFSVEPCAIFLLHFQVASLGPQKPTASAFTTRSRMSAILPAIQYPLQTHFHVSVLHRKPMRWTYAMAFNWHSTCQDSLRLEGACRNHG